MELATCQRTPTGYRVEYPGGVTLNLRGLTGKIDERTGGIWIPEKRTSDPQEARVIASSLQNAASDLERWYWATQDDWYKHLAKDTERRKAEAVTTEAP